MALGVHICAVGRLRSGPERDLLDDYLRRFDRTGRALGLGPVSVHEVEDKKGGGMRAEAPLLEGVIPKGAVICALDERGKLMSSPDFADMLAGWRDMGRGDVAFVIGGADGIDPSLRAQADAKLSFGKMVWPHMLVRVMLGEQLYRAASILAGAPYHRA
jgi:23S rRNA (pseudouridine1915-N3)-methyltransferase